MISTVLRVGSGLASRLRTWGLRVRGCRIEGRVWIRGIDVPRGHRRISLGNGVALDRGVTLLISGEASSAAITIGAGTYINRHTMVDASKSIRIGEHCMIGPFVYITDHDHTVGSDGRPASGELRVRPTDIGNRCWIGAHASVLKGVKIGDGAVVGAGSVVTKNVAPGDVVAGNPARVIRPTA